MNTYEARQQAKAERYRERAQRAREAADAAWKEHRAIIDQIPMGQPVLVGHHSERRHRRALERSDAMLRRTIEERDKAAYYEAKARRAENPRGISGDDPDAIEKLNEKIAKKERLQEDMKAVNRIVRRKLSDDEKVALIVEVAGVKPEIARTVLEPDYMGRVGFPDYALQNNRAEIRRLEERREELMLAFARQPREATIGEIRIYEDLEDNRTRVEFPGKPDEATRAMLKSHGFRWSRANGAWQRHVSNEAWYWAETIARKAQGLE